MYTKSDIYSRVAEILVEQFEVDETDVSPAATLQDDLDIDSIDAVNLMIELQSFTKQKVALKDVNEVRTVSDIVDAVYEVVEREKQSI